MNDTQLHNGRIYCCLHKRMDTVDSITMIIITITTTAVMQFDKQTKNIRLSREGLDGRARASF